MRALFTMLLLAVFAQPLQAQQAGPDAAAPDAVNVIEQQMQLFRDGDVAGAFAYAAPSLQTLFGTPENFGRMVAQGYPMVWRPGALRMLDQQMVAGALLQRLLVTDAAGRTHELEYRMIRTPDGWRIAGVRIVEAAAPLA